MTVAEMYLRTDNEEIVIQELDKVLYKGAFNDVPKKYLDKIVQKIGVDYEKEVLLIGSSHRRIVGCHGTSLWR